MDMTVQIGQENRMRKIIFFITILSLFTNCSIRRKNLGHFLSTLENVKFIASKEDSIKIENVKLNLQKTQESIDLGKSGAWICFEPYNHAEFRGGVTLFRELIYKKFKVSTNSKEGENLIRVTIGKSNNIEKIEILQYTDENSKKTIENVFRLKELNTWTSAKMYGIPVKQEFEISIFIKQK